MAKYNLNLAPLGRVFNDTTFFWGSIGLVITLMGTGIYAEHLLDEKIQDLENNYIQATAAGTTYELHSRGSIVSKNGDTRVKYIFSSSVAIVETGPESDDSADAIDYKIYQFSEYDDKEAIARARKAGCSLMAELERDKEALEESGDIRYLRSETPFVEGFHKNFCGPGQK